MNGTAFPLFLSLRVALAALTVIVPIGLVLGYIQARHDYRGRSLVDVLIVLPIVLPPSVTGYYLIVVLGRKGIVGGPLYELMGVSIIFTFLGGGDRGRDRLLAAFHQVRASGLS